MVKRLEYMAEQRTFARMSKMPVVTLYSSLKGNWREKVILLSAMVKTSRSWKLKFCGEESRKTAVTCVNVEIVMHGF